MAADGRGRIGRSRNKCAQELNKKRAERVEGEEVQCSSPLSYDAQVCVCVCACYFNKMYVK